MKKSGLISGLNGKQKSTENKIADYINNTMTSMTPILNNMQLWHKQKLCTNHNAKYS